MDLSKINYTVSFLQTGYAFAMARHKFLQEWFNLSHKIMNYIS